MRRGFTLIEMLVVLAVLAIAAHLAVRELGKVRERQQNDAANAQLFELRDAVWNIEADGAPSGFLSDMGRMPRSLDELWELPRDARRFAVTNVAAGVHVPSGWNGPYIRLPLGKSALYDPWGNDFHVQTNSAGFATNVFHMGASGQPRTRSGDVSLVPNGGDTSALVVALESAASAEVVLRLYWPDGAGGVTNATATATAANPARFSGIAPGRRVLSSNGMGTRLVNIRPGDNIIQLRIAQ